jgi:hypothetical protein
LHDFPFAASLGNINDTGITEAALEVERLDLDRNVKRDRRREKFSAYLVADS